MLRHAKASHDDSTITDHARPLTKKGRKAARFMGELLRVQGLVPDKIISSTAVRTRETTEAVAGALACPAEITYLDELYLAEPPAYLDALRRLGGGSESVLVVGHNPGIEALIYRLTGQAERMPTAALAQCILPIADWSELGPETLGELGKIFRPKELD